MATWYNDFTDGNDTTGNGSIGTPYKTLQKSASVSANGDTFYCTNGSSGNPEIFSSAYAWPKAGSNYNAYMKIIGCSTGFVDDGTTYKISGGGTSAGLFTFATKNYISWKNIEGYSVTGTLWDLNVGGGGLGHKFINCIFRNCVTGWYGFNTAQGTYFYRCRFNNCTSYGLSSGLYNNIAENCEFYSNGIAFANGYADTIVNCIFRDNTTAIGIWSTNSSGLYVYGCTFDGNTTAISSSNRIFYVMARSNTFTNNTTAISSNYSITEDFNLFLSNNTNKGGTGFYDTLYGQSLISGTDGYYNRAGKDYRRYRTGSLIGVTNQVGSTGTTTPTTNANYETAGQKLPYPTLPAVANVRQSTQYGDSGTELTGTLDLPSINDVRNGVTFDSASKTGNVVLPTAGNVVSGVGFGSLGTEYTGTLIADGIVITSVTQAGSVLTAACSGAGAAQDDGFVKIFSITDNRYVCNLSITSWSNTSVSGTPERSMQPGTYRFLIINDAGTSGTQLFTTTAEIEITSSPSDPVKQRILDAVVYGLTTISTDSGYYNTVRRVYDQPCGFDDLREFPAIIVDEGPETCANANEHLQTGGNQALLHNQLDIRLDCVVQVAEDAALARNKILADVQRYFGANYWLPGEDNAKTALDTIYLRSEPWGIDETKPLTGVTVFFRVWYRQYLTNPTLRG